MRKSAKSTGPPRKTCPALTPEVREDQLISLAVDLIEQRLRDGMATSQETTTLLKHASRKARLELEILESQKELISAKTDSIKARARMKELYSASRSTVLHPKRVRGHFGNPALASR